MTKPLWQRVQLPIMQCDSGCGECCGPVLCREGEYAKIEAFVAERGIVPVNQGSTCPFYQSGTCALYEVRPFVCRYFGHHERLVCCKGYNVNVTSRMARELDDSYGMPTRSLHEFVGMTNKQAVLLALEGK